MMLRGHVKEGNSQRQVKMLILTLCCARVHVCSLTLHYDAHYGVHDSMKECTHQGDLKHLNISAKSKNIQKYFSLFDRGRVGF